VAGWLGGVRGAAGRQGGWVWLGGMIGGAAGRLGGVRGAAGRLGGESVSVDVGRSGGRSGVRRAESCMHWPKCEEERVRGRLLGGPRQAPQRIAGACKSMGGPRFRNLAPFDSATPTPWRHAMQRCWPWMCFERSAACLRAATARAACGRSLRRASSSSGVQGAGQSALARAAVAPSAAALVQGAAAPGTLSCARPSELLPPALSFVSPPTSCLPPFLERAGSPRSPSTCPLAGPTAPRWSAAAT
jgi:hypothetical protein